MLLDSNSAGTYGYAVDCYNGVIYRNINGTLSQIGGSTIGTSSNATTIDCILVNGYLNVYSTTSGTRTWVNSTYVGLDLTSYAGTYWGVWAKSTTPTISAVALRY